MLDGSHGDLVAVSKEKYFRGKLQKKSEIVKKLEFCGFFFMHLLMPFTVLRFCTQYGDISVIQKLIPNATISKHFFIMFYF